VELEFVVVEFMISSLRRVHPHENGSLSKERGCEKGIAQVVEKKSGCAKCFRALVDGKVGGGPSPLCFS
jgi:hypothetical protein